MILGLKQKTFIFRFFFIFLVFFFRESISLRYYIASSFTYVQQFAPDKFSVRSLLRESGLFNYSCINTSMTASNAKYTFHVSMLWTICLLAGLLIAEETSLGSHTVACANVSRKSFSSRNNMPRVIQRLLFKRVLSVRDFYVSITHSHDLFI